jgi:hypothetical protein
MADEATIKNADLHAKTEDLNLSPKASAESGSALDALMQEAATKAGASAEDTAAAAAAKPDAAPPTKIDATSSIDDSLEQEKAAAQKAADDKAAAEKAATDKAAADKAEAEKAAGTTTTEKPVDPLDKIELPAHTSPKASESFAQVKKLAKEAQTALQLQIAERDTKLTEALGQLEKLKKDSGQLPEETKAELEELRKFKVAHEVESDPKFREFDSSIKGNNESIYKKLAANGFTAENIEKIRELGGPEAVDWEPLFPKMNFQIRQFVQSKLVENVTLADKREEALSAAKANGQAFLAERSQREVTELANTANAYTKNLPWTAEKTVPANATPEQKAEIEAQNVFARDSMGRLKHYLGDRSPARFAELAVGTLLAHKFQADLTAVKAQLTSTTEAHKTALDTLTKERDALKVELDKIKRAEIPRLRGDSDLSPISPAKDKGKLDFRSGEEALDDLAKQAMAAQNA